MCAVLGTFQLGEVATFFEISYVHMFRVWDLNMLMFASGIVRSSEVKLRQQKGVSRSSLCIAASRGCQAPAVNASPRLTLARSEYRRELCRD